MRSLDSCALLKGERMDYFGYDVAQFEKISFGQYSKDVLGKEPDKISQTVAAMLRVEYENIKLPTRATNGSAGYDFYIPAGWAFQPGMDNKIFTGIRVKLKLGWMLAMYPRSGLGFKFGASLKNTTGIIDSDYYNAENEGHIIVNMRTQSEFILKDQERFVQGILIPYGLCTGDSFDLGDKRIGGFGSTGR